MLSHVFNASIFLTLLATVPGKAAAYLDPGSGSFILQVIIASLVGIGFTLRAYWGKITKFFRKGGQDELEDDDLADE
jgi:hypothetical protein